MCRRALVLAIAVMGTACGGSSDVANTPDADHSVKGSTIFAVGDSNSRFFGCHNYMAYNPTSGLLGLTWAEFAPGAPTARIMFTTFDPVTSIARAPAVIAPVGEARLDRVAVHPDGDDFVVAVEFDRDTTVFKVAGTGGALGEFTDMADNSDTEPNPNGGIAILYQAGTLRIASTIRTDATTAAAKVEIAPSSNYQGQATLGSTSGGYWAAWVEENIGVRAVELDSSGSPVGAVNTIVASEYDLKSIDTVGGMVMLTMAERDALLIAMWSPSTSLPIEPTVLSQPNRDESPTLASAAFAGKILIAFESDFVGDRVDAAVIDSTGLIRTEHVSDEGMYAKCPTAAYDGERFLVGFLGLTRSGDQRFQVRAVEP